MREPLKDKNRLEHILDAIEIICQRTSGMSFDDFTADKVVYGGIVLLYHNHRRSSLQTES